MAAGLACPECGDPAPVVAAARVVRCGACQVTLYIEDAPAPRVMIEPVLARDGALAAAQRWMRKLRHREGLARRATCEAPRLVYLPFARIEAEILGWVFGQRKHEKDNKTYYTDEEIHVAQPFEQVVPLSGVGELGVERLPDLADVVTLPFDENAIAGHGGELVPALGSEATASERAHEGFLASAHADHDLCTITGDSLTVLGARETVLSYPFWRVDYRYGGVSYHVVIDARTGEIAYGRAPGSRWYAALAFGIALPIGAAILVTVTFLALGFLVVGYELMDVSAKLGGLVWLGTAIGAGVGGILGLYITLVGYRALAEAAEVESGYGAHAGADLSDLDTGDYGAALTAERAEVAADPVLAAFEAPPEAAR